MSNKFNNTNRFAAIAQQETTLSEVMIDREKISTDEIIARFPNGVTVTEFDIIEQGNKVYPVFAIAEDESICFFGGMVLYKIAARWLEAYEGCLEDCVADLKKSGGVKIKLKASKTAAGRNITSVEVLG